MLFGDHSRRGINWFFVLIYLIIGIYFLNYPFGLFSIPEFISNFDKWIIFVAGVFMIVGAISSIRLGRRY